jgi:ADP-ribosylglycohydrolase
MIGAIVGDILGSRWEGTSEKPDLEKPLFYEDSRQTDDSVLSVATAHAILHHSSFEDAYRSFFRLYSGSITKLGRGFPAGYGPMFVNWAMDDERKQGTSYGNGSAMRVSPIGWAATSRKEAIEMARTSAICTHNHPEGIKGAEAIALAIYLARTGKSKDYIFPLLSSTFEYPLEFDLLELHDNYEFNATCPGSVPQALACVFRADSFEEAMMNALYIGGDSDTICAIAGSVAEPLWGVPEEYSKKAMSLLERYTPMLAGIVQQFEDRYGSNTTSKTKEHIIGFKQQLINRLL